MPRGVELILGYSKGPAIFASNKEIIIRIPLSSQEISNNRGDRALFLRAKIENECEKILDSIRSIDDA